MWGYWAMRESFKRACQKLSLQDLKLYEVGKHSFATDALRRTKDERAVQAALRHRDRRSTERYARLADGAVLEVLRPKARHKRA